jgi:hypothetical protein
MEEEEDEINERSMELETTPAQKEGSVNEPQKKQ